jgi:pyridoxamine 5'-phosphate oxidase family protein
VRRSRLGFVETRAVDDPPVNPDWFANEIIRIVPHRVISWHIDRDNPDGESRDL